MGGKEAWGSGLAFRIRKSSESPGIRLLYLSKRPLLRLGSPFYIPNTLWPKP